MANLLSNMLKLQETHRIPMRMDLSKSQQLEYYKFQVNDENNDEKKQLLKEVIRDLTPSE